MATYHHMDRIAFLNLIKNNWFGPVKTAQHYAELCNKAEEHNMEIVAMLENGIVYKLKTQA
jgi:hypothetical protein